MTGRGSNAITGAELDCIESDYPHPLSHQSSSDAVSLGGPNHLASSSRDSYSPVEALRSPDRGSNDNGSWIIHCGGDVPEGVSMINDEESTLQSLPSDVLRRNRNERRAQSVYTPGQESSSTEDITPQALGPRPERSTHTYSNSFRSAPIMYQSQSLPDEERPLQSGSQDLGSITLEPHDGLPGSPTLGGFRTMPSRFGTHTRRNDLYSLPTDVQVPRLRSLDVQNIQHQLDEYSKLHSSTMPPSVMVEFGPSTTNIRISSAARVDHPEAAHHFNLGARRQTGVSTTVPDPSEIRHRMTSRSRSVDGSDAAATGTPPRKRRRGDTSERELASGGSIVPRATPEEQRDQC